MRRRVESLWLRVVLALATLAALVIAGGAPTSPAGP